MNYLLKNSNSEARKRESRNKIALGMLSVFLVLVILSTPLIRGFLFNLASPIWKGEHLLSRKFVSMTEYFRFKSNLIEENQTLKAGASSTAVLIALNDVLRIENDQLKSLLDRKVINNDSVLGVVMVKSPAIPYDNIIIDVGSQSGIKTGDKVIVEGSVYIGEVVEVYNDESKVKLYSTPGNKLNIVLEKNSIHAEAEGLGNGNFMIKLPKEIGVSEGDPIIIPSISPNIFGLIEKIESRDKDSFQKILFKSPVNLSEIIRVEVLIK